MRLSGPLPRAAAPESPHGSFPGVSGLLQERSMPASVREYRVVGCSTLPPTSTVLGDLCRLGVPSPMIRGAAPENRDSRKLNAAAFALGASHAPSGRPRGTISTLASIDGPRLPRPFSSYRSSSPCRRGTIPQHQLGGSHRRKVTSRPPGSPSGGGRALCAALQPLAAEDSKPIVPI